MICFGIGSTGTADRGGLADADPQAVRASALHPRAAEGGRRAALLRRDEGCARSALEIRHPPADHGAGGARLHPPPAQPGARHRGDQAARVGRARRRRPRARGFTPSVIEGNLGRVRAPLPPRTTAARPIAVPVMGRIAAGTPIEAIQTRSHTINMPPDLLSAGEHFALEVRGDSMIEAGILDGDMALIRRTESRRHRRHRGGADRRRGGDPQALPPPRRLDRARAGQYLPTRSASCRPTACASRASWSACSAATEISAARPSP